MKPLFTLSGTVITGKKRGRTLGFPTANIQIPQDIPEGIYASTVEIDKKIYPAASFVGKAKTFNESDHKLESYILDFSEIIYGKEIEVTLFKKIRSNKVFISKDDLILEMGEDIKATREFFLQNLILN